MRSSASNRYINICRLFFLCSFTFSSFLSITIECIIKFSMNVVTLSAHASLFIVLQSCRQWKAPSGELSSLVGRFQQHWVPSKPRTFEYYWIECHEMSIVRLIKSTREGIEALMTINRHRRNRLAMELYISSRSLISVELRRILALMTNEEDLVVVHM